MYEYDFSGISNDYNGFTTSEIALTFTFSVTGISVAQPAMSELGVPAKPGIGVSLSRPGISNSFENR